MLLTSCGSQETTEEPYIPVSTQQDSVQLDDLYVSGIGQYTGFNVNGDVVELYPYFDIDRKVSVRKIGISNNNFWYDFIKAQGYSMANVRLYPSGVMVLPTPTTSFGYYCVNDTTAIFAYSSDLPWSYVNLALNHAGLSAS